MNLNIKKVSVPVLMFMMFQSGFCTNNWFGEATSSMVEGNAKLVTYHMVKDGGATNITIPAVQENEIGGYKDLSTNVKLCIPRGYTGEEKEALATEIADKLLKLTNTDSTEETIKETVIEYFFKNLSVDLQENPGIDADAKAWKTAFDNWPTDTDDGDKAKREKLIKGTDTIWANLNLSGSCTDESASEVKTIFTAVEDRGGSVSVWDAFVPTLSDVLVVRINDYKKNNNEEEVLKNLKRLYNLWFHRNVTNGELEGILNDHDVSTALGISGLDLTNFNTDKAEAVEALEDALAEAYCKTLGKEMENLLNHNAEDTTDVGLMGRYRSLVIEGVGALDAPYSYAQYKGELSSKDAYAQGKIKASVIFGGTGTVDDIKTALVVIDPLVTPNT